MKGENTSSTSISVSWEDQQAGLQNGIITGYWLTYQSLTENDNRLVPACPNDLQVNLEALKEFASYCLPLLSRGLEIKVSLSFSLQIKTVSTVLVSPSRLLFIHLRSL